MLEENSHRSIFGRASDDPKSHSFSSSTSGSPSGSSSVSGYGWGYGSGVGSSSGKGDVLRRLIGGDMCKRAIFDVLSSGNWCTVFELCRVARSWDRGVGLVRVSTILTQSQQVLGSDFLECRMGQDTTEWRINPDFLRTVAGVLSEVKAGEVRMDSRASDGVKEYGAKPSGGLLRSLLSRASQDTD
ncbi:MAG: hypothetical protein KIH08_12910 [Candidatus Freyarchaeota archaeon]|nr:hypothetical protein [Candidatus Jordarchaeia archaeon]MBS7268129.1 hypothetical protein [Candidatus Jordarchaeia archaeon]MBS7278587.1 hypothetical protein [Candidatus Jordarchaeia archaeon]